LQKQNYLSSKCLPEQIRVSLGTAIILGLLEGKLDAEPTTAYFMTYRSGKCTANCGFCPQAKGSKSNAELLSRVSWPIFSTSKVLEALAESARKNKIKRVCIQALNYPDVFNHLEALVQEIKQQNAIPVSVSCQPQNKTNIKRLAQAGVDRLGIALDAATESVFNLIKGKDTGSTYTWKNQFLQLEEALEIFGKGKVSTHVIVGLGETEKQIVEILQIFKNIGVLPALFAFTPVRGTSLESKSPPNIESYRRIQLGRYLIVNDKARFQDMSFDSEGKIVEFGLEAKTLERIVVGGLPFRTSGCPDCNRPFYNEKPSGPLYNYPKKPNSEELQKIKKQLS
jgi:biotin synthase-related radical SAM superfamily protein